MLSFTKYTDKTRVANNNYFCRSTSAHFFFLADFHHKIEGRESVYCNICMVLVVSFPGVSFPSTDI